MVGCTWVGWLVLVERNFILGAKIRFPCFGAKALLAMHEDGHRLGIFGALGFVIEALIK